MPRPESLATAGHFPTPQRICEAIAKLIQVVDYDPDTDLILDSGNHRILDPCCSDGAALHFLAQTIEQNQYDSVIEAYGVELHRDRAETAAKRLTQVLHADLFQTLIGSATCSALFLNPPYDFDLDAKRAENSFLLRATPALQPEGLLILIIPQNRLTSCSRTLSLYYHQAECWSFPEPEYQAFGQVILFARRKNELEPDPELPRLLQEWQANRPPPLPCPDDLLVDPDRELPVYEIRPGAEDPITFCVAATPVSQAVKEAAAGAGAWKRPEPALLLKPPDQLQTAPLMPPRRGQMALMAAAGMLNNLTLDDGENRVIIKGRTVKRHELASETETSQTWQDRLYTTLTVLNLEDGEILEVA